MLVRSFNRSSVSAVKALTRYHTKVKTHAHAHDIQDTILSLTKMSPQCLVMLKESIIVNYIENKDPHGENKEKSKFELLRRTPDTVCRHSN